MGGRLGRPGIADTEDFSRGNARRRWAEIIRLVYELNPLECLRCGGAMRPISLIQDPAGIDKIRHGSPGG